ncbi:unnamed protein product [Bemisia tabaci]|uniref:Uncharacterized protein n=1 Tax=Bemisia tabaci TaxID=7038 RepID=A0A9P0ANH4_BEMTA|nr:unnamed protein product [Bemisia tabaci]
MTMREMQRPHLLVEEEKHISSNDHYENCNLVLAQKFLFLFDVLTAFECCGVDSPRDWMPYFSLSYVPVPLSCCAHYEEKLRRGEKCYARLNESSYQLGCYTQLQTVVADHFNWMLLSGVAPTLTEMTGLMLTLIVAKAIKTDMMLKKTRPWAR